MFLLASTNLPGPEAQRRVWKYKLSPLLCLKTVSVTGTGGGGLVISALVKVAAGMEEPSLKQPNRPSALLGTAPSSGWLPAYLYQYLEWELAVVSSCSASGINERAWLPVWPKVACAWYIYEFMNSSHHLFVDEQCAYHRKTNEQIIYCPSFDVEKSCMSCLIKTLFTICKLNVYSGILMSPEVWSVGVYDQYCNQPPGGHIGVFAQLLYRSFHTDSDCAFCFFFVFLKPKCT